MARGRPRAGHATRAPANDLVTTGAAPEANGNGLAKAYRHKSEKRTNIPPAAIAAEGRVPAAPKLQYSYSPRLDPLLRFDPTGAPDRLPELLERAKREPLTDTDVRILAQALRRHDPWLEWAGKREAGGFEVDPVALHIHERVSAQAILKVAARKDVTRDLFADPQLDYHQAAQFYRHEMDWTNRLILGDSLQVMTSLAQREDLAGKLQMIYIDPPYGIKYASNFQPRVGQTRVGDADSDISRETEVVKAYRDTWHLGVHSYLNYMRDRLSLAKQLICDSGSIFVQIGGDNAHRVRLLLEEIFGSENLVSVIAYKTAIGMGSELLDCVHDHIIWFAKKIGLLKFRPLFSELAVGEVGATRYKQVESVFTGESRLTTEEERNDPSQITEIWRPYRDQGLTSRSASATTLFPVEFEGGRYQPPSGGWRTNEVGLNRVARAERVIVTGDNISYKKFFEDSPSIALTDFWADTGGGITSRTDPKVYAVQTSPRIIERCMLMSTDPGDLVLDPTCGAGTTAFVAEQFGRRWITIDTSRVAIAIARQRLLTAKFDYYDLKDNAKGLSSGLRCKTVKHITLRSIAQNTNLDPIFAKHEPSLEKALSECNALLARAPPDLKTKLAAKLLAKQRAKGKRSITDADRRRWLFPPDNRGKDALTVDAKFRGWYQWEVPFDTDPDWPNSLQDAVTAYRVARRAKMDEVNACIQANAKDEELERYPNVLNRRASRGPGGLCRHLEIVACEQIQLDRIPLSWINPTCGAGWFGSQVLSRLRRCNPRNYRSMTVRLRLAANPNGTARPLILGSLTPQRCRWRAKKIAKRMQRTRIATSRT